MTIKLKITSLFLFFSFVILLLFSSFILLRSYFLIYSTIDRNIKTIADNIEQKIPDNREIICNRYIIRVYSKNKKILYESTLSKKLKNFPDFFPKYSDYFFKNYEIKVKKNTFLYLNPDKRREIEFRVYCKKFDKGYILIAYPMEATEESFQNLLLIVAWGIGIFLFLIAVAGFYFSYTTLKPINEIIKKANYISAKSLHTRIHINSNDELGKLAQTLNSLFERLEKHFKKQKEFTSNVSHELKTPLAMIKLSLENTLKSDSLPVNLKKSIHQIIENIKRLQNLISKLLLLSQIDYMQNNPEITKKFEKINLSELIYNLSNEFKDYFKEKQIKFLLSIENEKIYMEGEKDLLEKLFFNLFLNAYNFTGENGKIEVKLENNLFFIKNSCKGISKGKLPYIFERFYRVDTSRNRETGNTGLGLSICKSIADLHQINISVKSDGKSYALFIIKF